MALQSIVDTAPYKLSQISIDGVGSKQYSNIETIYTIKGDQLIAGISAASILAKVARDSAMIYIDKKYPEYGFASHKGYGTAKHKEMLHKYGSSPAHRKSFAPVKAVQKRTVENSPA